jgi:hypothetical protein
MLNSTKSSVNASEAGRAGPRAGWIWLSLIAFWPPDLLIYLVALLVGSYAGALIIPSGRERRMAVAR